MHYGIRPELGVIFLGVMMTLVVVLVLVLRWFTYRERMAMIEHNKPIDKRNALTSKSYLAVGLITALAGLAITLGLITIGIGPWLLVGLIPLFVGLAIILSHIVALPETNKSAAKEPVPLPTPIALQEQEFGDDSDEEKDSSALEELTDDETSEFEPLREDECEEKKRPQDPPSTP